MTISPDFGLRVSVIVVASSLLSVHSSSSSAVEEEEAAAVLSAVRNKAVVLQERPMFARRVVADGMTMLLWVRW